MKPIYTCIAIDDDPLFLEIFEFLAQQVKCLDLIKTYTNSVEGAMGAVKYKPDILFLDIEMPYLDGHEAMAALTHKPKIVMISAHTRYDTESLDWDISKFVSKPIRDPEHLESIVREVMQE